MSNPFRFDFQNFSPGRLILQPLDSNGVPTGERRDLSHWLNHPFSDEKAIRIETFAYLSQP